MLNKVILIGNLGQDPETRFTSGGTCVCNIRIATTEKFKGRDGEQQERTEWHRVVLWDRLGEIANQYLRKGSQVYIEGKIETRKWQDKDGQDRYTTEIRATEMKMLGSRGGAGGGDEFGGGSSSRGNDRSNDRGDNRARSSGNPNRNNDPFADSGGYGGGLPMDDDIPF